MTWKCLDLKNIDLTVDGIYDKKTGIYRIERITSFKNLDTAINRPIQFHFTSKKSYNRSKMLKGKVQTNQNQRVNLKKIE